MIKEQKKPTKKIAPTTSLPKLIALWLLVSLALQNCDGIDRKMEGDEYKSPPNEQKRKEGLLGAQETLPAEMAQKLTQPTSTLLSGVDMPHQTPISHVHPPEALPKVAQRGNVPTVARLLEQDADPNTAYLKTSLEKELDSLLAKKSNIEARDKEGKTPLTLACYKNDIVSAKMLLMSGAEIEARDKCGYNPLFHAIERGNSALVEMLLDNGADIEATMMTRDPDCGKHTPLMHAFFCSEDDIAKILSNRGASVAPIVNIQYGYNLFMEIVTTDYEEDEKYEEQQDELLSLLLYNKANIETKDNNGSTALMNAIQTGNRKIAEILLDKKADIAAKNKNGDTVLHLLDGATNDKTIKFLLHSRANLEAKNNNGDTPLTASIFNDKLHVINLVEKLLDNKANIAAKDNFGCTAIMQVLNKESYRTGYENDEIIDLLLTRGAAAQHEHLEVITSITPPQVTLLRRSIPIAVLKSLSDYKYEVFCFTHDFWKTGSNSWKHDGPISFAYLSTQNSSLLLLKLFHFQQVNTTFDQTTLAPLSSCHEHCITKIYDSLLELHQPCAVILQTTNFSKDLLSLVVEYAAIDLLVEYLKLRDLPKKALLEALKIIIANKQSPAQQ
jgi:ankyrin repeat protein